MDRHNWKLYKKNNIEQLWKVNNIQWINELFNFKSVKILSKFKFGNIICNKYIESRFLLKHKPILPYFAFFITTKCTLNCKNCNSMMPKYTEKTHSKPIKFEVFKKDLDTLLQAVDYINVFVLVGGEPMLAHDLPQIIKYAISKKQIKHILLATNCTILPSEKLLKAMKNPKFSVQISDYSHVKNIKNDVQVKYDEFKKLLQENGIKFNNYQEKRNANTWFSMPEIYKDRRAPELLTKQFDKCFANYCPTICDGIISQDFITVYIQRNLDSTTELQKELINIRELKSSKELAEEIINFYSKPYSKFCNYCHFENIKYGLPCGEQVE